MNVDTFVLSLRQVGGDEALSQQTVNVMNEIGEKWTNPVVAKIELISERFEAKIHQEMNALTWRFIGLGIALIGAFAAIQKFVH